jgi:hypothetical protein
MVKRYPLPPQERLKELFDYDPETGIVLSRGDRRSRRNPFRAGEVMGYPDPAGYLKVTVDHQLCALHRVIWKWMTGQEPPDYIDHINRVRADNRWANLREADAVKNAGNTTRNVRFKTGHRGVNPAQYAGKWSASIRHEGRTYKLGEFSTEAAAIEAYQAKAKELRGEFATLDDMPPTLVDVLTLVDEDLLFTAASTVRQMRAFRLDPDVPEHVKVKLDELGAALSNELARVDPGNYGQMGRPAVSP